MNTNVMVSNEVRNANNRAITERNRWRKEYRIISSNIRYHKETLAKMSALNLDYTDQSKMMNQNLRLLQWAAHQLMLERPFIRECLKKTAYPYANKISV
jgi:hypothetical protein